MVEEFALEPVRPEHWKEHGPVALKSLALTDIDAGDKTFQFRFPCDRKSLLRSLQKHGQLNPIKVIAGGDGYRIVDGHGRVEGIKDLGWECAQALIYGGMSDRQAKGLSYESNATRSNLSFAEKANAMQDAVNDGFTREHVAKFFGVSSRTVDRHLELPEEIRRHIDCKVVTMAHGKLLVPLLGNEASASLDDMLDWIRTTRASVAQLNKRLRKLGLSDRRGATRKFGTLNSDTIHFYRFRVNAKTPGDQLHQLIEFLSGAIERIRRLSEQSAGE